MARRKTPVRTEPLPDATITDAPGPEASADVLRLHYTRVQEYLSTHAYDDIIFLCHWCLSGDPLTEGRVGVRGGQHLYCAERCAQAADAYVRN